jgi:5'(3')-deoxyribonucleotidase
MKLGVDKDNKVFLKRTLYVDMDGVLVDFYSGVNRLSAKIREKYPSNPEDAPGIFALMDPIPGAIDALNRLKEKYAVYILSTAPWDNPSGWSDKLNWVKDHLDPYFTKRLILCHHKNLLKGSYLIDDRPKHGSDHFGGEWIQFGSPEFPDWKAVLEYLDA